jgi:KipI family sensor histidine kinase inhibitor
MRIEPYGPNAVLITFADKLGDETFARGRALARALEQNRPPGLVEYVPAFTTMLLEFEDRIPDLSFLDQIATGDLPYAPIKEIPVIYNGPDLQRVADHARLTVDEVRERHAAVTYKVYMLGFSPGFPYLGDVDPRLHTPRLPTPRIRVPAGSVALGGQHTGIYPSETPGGWNIIGHAATKLFDPAHMTFFLQHGDRVRFVPH